LIATKLEVFDPAKYPQVSCSMTWPEVAEVRNWTCPDDKADMPNVYSHNRYSRYKRYQGMNRKKKRMRCGYCKKALVPSHNSPGNLTHSEAIRAG